MTTLLCGRITTAVAAAQVSLYNTKTPVLLLLLYYCIQVTYTFCYDFITLLVKDAQTAEFGRTEVLVEGLTRVSVSVLFSVVGLPESLISSCYPVMGKS